MDAESLYIFFDTLNGAKTDSNIYKWIGQISFVRETVKSIGVPLLAVSARASLNNDFSKEDATRLRNLANDLLHRLTRYWDSGGDPEVIWSDIRDLKQELEDLELLLVATRAGSGYSLTSTSAESQQSLGSPEASASQETFDSRQMYSGESLSRDSFQTDAGIDALMFPASTWGASHIPEKPIPLLLIMARIIFTEAYLVLPKNEHGGPEHTLYNCSLSRSVEHLHKALFDPDRRRPYWWFSQYVYDHWFFIKEAREVARASWSFIDALARLRCRKPSDEAVQALIEQGQLSIKLEVQTTLRLVCRKVLKTRKHTMAAIDTANLLYQAHQSLQREWQLHSLDRADLLVATFYGLEIGERNKPVGRHEMRSQSEVKNDKTETKKNIVAKKRWHFKKEKSRSNETMELHNLPEPSRLPCS